MSKLVIGIVVVAVIIGIFMFSMRDSVDLAPRIVKPVNSTNSTLMPDLLISNLTYYLSNGSSNNGTSNCTNGSSLWNVYISVSERNVGNANALASTTRVGFSRLSSPFTNFIQQVPVQQLAPNGNALFGFTTTGCTGNYLINATADSSNVVGESNEFNNARSVNLILP